MANANELLKLIDAGFSADEIRAMGLLAERSEDPAPEPDPAPADPEPKPAPADPSPALQDKVLEKLEALTGMISKALVVSTGRPTPSQDSADDILASIFYPKSGEEVK